MTTMEFYVLGMILVPLALAVVSGIIESRLVEDEEETCTYYQEHRAA